MADIEKADESKKGKYGFDPGTALGGKVASNVTGEAIQSNFNYGEITDEHKKVVSEIIDLLRQRSQVPVDMIIEELKTRFELEEIPMKNIEDSVWGQLTKDEAIGTSIQGFRMTTDADGKKIKIPHVGFSADFDYLDEFVNRLTKRLKDLEVK